MPAQSWQEVLVSQQAVGSSFGGYTTAKTVINPQALWVMPAGFLSVGKVMRFKIAGSLSTLVTTPGTITFQIKFGSVVVFDSGAIQLNATAHTTIPFMLDIQLTCRAVGSGTSANMIGIGLLVGKMFTLTAGQTDDVQSHIAITVPVTAPAVGTGFDSTIANIVDFWAGFSISNAANAIQIQQYTVESVN